MVFTRSSPAATANRNQDEAESLDAETKLWSELPVDAWKQSVLTKESIFHELYQDTRRRLIEAVKTHSFDVILEVGCGTGEVIAHLEEVGIPRIGIDINAAFVDHCSEVYGGQSDLTFTVADATELSKWWDESGNANKYRAPLLVCPNNTLMIMPESIREDVLKEMRSVAGVQGRTCVTFWNKKMFAHGMYTRAHRIDLPCTTVYGYCMYYTYIYIVRIHVLLYFLSSNDIDCFHITYMHPRHRCNGILQEESATLW